MLINAKINDTTQKMLWSEAINTCKHIRKSTATTGITTSPFEIFMEKTQHHWFVPGVWTYQIRH